MADINDGKQLKNKQAEADLNIFAPREIMETEAREILEKIYVSLERDTPPSKDVFAVLFSYFKNNNFSALEMEKYKDSFWKMLVKVSWHILSRLNQETFIEVVARTLPYAVAEGINVKEAVFSEFYGRPVEQAQATYDRIKEKISAMDYPIGFNEAGREITLSMLARKIRENSGAEDLARFELFSKAQKALFPDNEFVHESMKQGYTKSMTEFIEVLSFFANNVNPVDTVVKYVVEKPEYDEPKYDEKVKGMVAANLIEKYVLQNEEGDISLPPADRTPKKSPPQLTKTPNKAVEKKKPETAKEESFAELLAKHKNDFSEWAKNTETLRQLLVWLGSFRQKSEARQGLKNLLERELGDKPSDDMEIAQAIIQLDEFLNKNNYSGADMIYFDENEGRFNWSK